MKRMIIALALIAVSVFGSSAEVFFVGARAQSCLDQIEETDRLMRKLDYSAALKKCREAEDYWESSGEAVDILLIHDYVDDIRVSLGQMRAHIENGSPDMYFSESAGAKKGLASIKGSEYPNFENIL